MSEKPSTPEPGERSSANKSLGAAYIRPVQALFVGIREEGSLFGTKSSVDIAIRAYQHEEIFMRGQRCAYFAADCQEVGTQTVPDGLAFDLGEWLRLSAIEA
jgi:hypothetical protein